MKGDGARQNRRFATRVKQVARAPIDHAAKQAIMKLLVASTLDRMVQGKTPSGAAFPPLSRGYVRYKQRTRGQTGFWQLTGASKARTDAFETERGVRLTINTPTSGYVHDGATSTRHARVRGEAEKARHAKAMKSRVRANNKRLLLLYGGKSAKANRATHALALREAAVARRHGLASTLRRSSSREEHANRSMAAKSARAVKAGRASKLARTKKTSWVVRLPARPVLGVSKADAAAINRIIAISISRRLESPDA